MYKGGTMTLVVHVCTLLLAGILIEGGVPGLKHKAIREQTGFRRQVLGGCDGIFADASHCWPFNTATADVSPDLKGGFSAMLKDGARLVDSVARGKVVSTLEPGSSIDIEGDLKGKCISSPRYCVNGFTMMFWAKIEHSAVLTNPSEPKDLFASGGAKSRSRGFCLFHIYNSWQLKVANGVSVWTVFIPDSHIPFNSWFSFAFIWDRTEGEVKYYVNGKARSAYSTTSAARNPGGDLFNGFTISKPNINNMIDNMLPMKFDQLVTWGRILQPQEITQAFNEGSGIPSTEAPTTAPPTTAPPTTALPTTAPPTTAPPTTTPPTTTPPTTAPPTTTPPTTAAGGTTPAATTAAATTAAASTGSPSTGATSTAAPTTATAPTGGTTSARGSTAAATTAASTTKGPTTRTTSAGGSTAAATTAASTTKGPTTTTSGTEIPTTKQPAPDIKQLIRDVISEINLFRRFHQSPDVTPSGKLNQLANQWAMKIAAEGVEKIDTNSTYGQLVCSHNAGGNIAKACAVKWYGSIKYFDWAEPKLTIKASPFTQMVWKSNSLTGIGIAKGAGGFKRQNVGGKYYLVVLFDPGQDAKANIGENILPAVGISEPAPQATCPEGYFKLPQGSRSCFSVKTTPLTWDDALYSCTLNNGTLASFQCKEEADLAVELLTKSNTTEAWIGMHDRSKEGRYVWIDGSSIPFSEWLQGEPNGDTAENCIVQAIGNYVSGWADRSCSERKAFVCEVPLSGYTTYKLTFNLTEPRSQSYQNNLYSKSLSPGSYSMCTPYVQSGNDLLKERITRYFQAKNIAVQPIVNTIRCLPNGLSVVEVILRLGPETGSDSITSLQTSIKENNGELKLSNGGSAKLISVTIVNPGVSYCPSQCASTSCQLGCDQICCTPSTAV